MSYKNKKILAVIPARGGSKGIKQKNIQPLSGIPLIGHVGMLVQSLSWLDYHVLSSDDLDIIRVGQQYDLNAPFVRPDYLSGDKASSSDAWLHAWDESEKITGEQFDLSILLEPTSPMRCEADLIGAIDLLLDESLSSVVTVSPTPAHYKPHKTLELKGNLLSFYLENGEQYSIRQNIPDYCHRNGVCYVVTREQLFQKKAIIGKQCGGYMIERDLVNIDEPIDLAFAEFLMSND